MHLHWLSLLLLLPFSATAAEPVRIILDTDMYEDCDDAAALAMLHVLDDRGECDLLGVMVNGPSQHGLKATDMINTYYGRPDLPIGVAEELGTKQIHSWTFYIRDKPFPADITRESAPPATELYRRLLAESPDKSVVIASVGFLNNLARLMESPPDGISPLSGKELIQAKVRELAVMGGNYQRGGSTYNLDRHYQEAAAKVINGWPGRVTYLGEEIARLKPYLNGPRLWSETGPGNPVRYAYTSKLKWTEDKQRAWHIADQATVLYAVRGTGNHFRLETKGSNHMPPDKPGYVKWRETPDPEGDQEQAYLVLTGTHEALNREIEDLMVAPPKTAPAPKAP